MPKIFHCDAFTTEKFKGNPAAVCLLDKPADANWMQSVAAEMNLSETAFLWPREDGFDLRWFTPTVEVDLCGHATLASAQVLYENGIVPAHEEIRFFTKSGVLKINRIGDVLEMDFPAEPATEILPPPVLLRALGVAPLYVGQNRMDILVQVGEDSIVKELDPDFHELAQIPTRGIILTSRSSDSRYDFVSRFFAPRVGINEDPVTGSAHCCLGPFWARQLDKKDFTAFQASKRSGIVHVRLRGDRVLLGGHAIILLRGEFFEK